MAVTSSMIINDDQSDAIFSPLRNTAPQEQANLSNTQSKAVSEDLMAEIQDIQQAMQDEKDFDFSTLEPPAAGNTQDATSLLNNEKSFASPVLLEDAGLLINYRGNDNISSASSSQEQVDTPIQETIGSIEDSTLTAINENNVDQVQASVSEDFITQIQGKLESNQNLSAQTLDTSFGSFSTDGLGNWQYTLNNELAEIQSLSAGNAISDLINLTTNAGQKIQIAIEINGTNDQAIITGSKQGNVQASPIDKLDNTQPSISGKLTVSDIDQGEARFETNFDLKGSFGSAQINALGEWSYTLNNNADAIQGLRSGEKLLDLFSVKTLDGSKQLIQINIEGVNDKPILSGSNAATLDLESESSTTNSLFINDPDFGESSFQELSGIRSSLGYGTADIDAQGNWTFNLDIEYTRLNSINEGETRIDSFEVFTMDGTRQELLVSIKGSNSPLYSQEDSLQEDSLASNTKALAFTDLIKEAEQQDEISFALNENFKSNEAQDYFESTQLNTSQIAETALYLNSSHDAIQTLNSNLNDINIG
tara:strand:+ start:6303 stop:7910 length:1608 start_codon:yes stop_codon:yes gene_type:complete